MRQRRQAAAHANGLQGSGQAAGLEHLGARLRQSRRCAPAKACKVAQLLTHNRGGRRKGAEGGGKGGVDLGKLALGSAKVGSAWGRARSRLELRDARVTRPGHPGPGRSACY